MSDFHQMLRDRQYYLEVGPPPAEEEVLAAQQALGLGEAYDLKDLQNTPESLPILGGDVPGQEDFTPKNTLGGLADHIDEGLMKGVEIANESFIDEFDAVFQRYKPGTLETLRESGGIQPLNVSPTDNPNVFINNDTGEQIFLDGNDAIEVRGENGPQIFMRQGTDLNTGEKYDLTETNPLMNFGRYLNTGSIADPIAVGGDALAPLIRMFQSLRGQQADPTVLGSGVVPDSFEAYRDQVNPSGRTIAADDRPNLRMGDMYGMLPKNSEIVSNVGDDITIHRSSDGDFYATAYNPDVGEEDVVGFIRGGDDSTELAVVEEMQGQGIGSELQFLFRAENPNAPTGGLTEAGESRLESTYDRLVSEGIVEIDEAKETDLRRILDIKADEMQLKPADRTQPSGEQMFDVTPEAYARGIRQEDQVETPVPRAPAGKKLPKKERLQLVVDNMDEIAERLAERARPHVGTNVQYFYHLGPLVDKAAELGIPEAQAREAIEEFAALYGATSPRTRTEPNLRSATLVRAKDKQGINYDEIVGPGGSGINEAGYPMMINEAVPGKGAGIHKILIDRLRETGEIDYRTNPKPATFVENVKGNLQGVTVDTHAIRGALYALNEIAPGSLTRQWFKTDAAYQRYLDDPSDISNYSGDDVADTLEGQMVDGVKQQTEYAVLSDLYKKVAERLGVMPAEAQSLSWFANGDITGLGSAPKSIVELINERIDVTAQATGESKNTIFKGFLEGKIPLLSASGILLGGGMLAGPNEATAAETDK